MANNNAEKLLSNGMRKAQDLISDKIPIVGKLDDIAVLTFALKFVQPELETFKTWSDNQTA